MAVDPKLLWNKEVNFLLDLSRHAIAWYIEVVNFVASTYHWALKANRLGTSFLNYISWFGGSNLIRWAVLPTYICTLRLNEYPDRFLVKHMKSMLQKPSKVGVEKKLLCMNLAFKGEVTSELLVRRLPKVVDNTLPAAKLKLTFSTNPLLKPQLKDRLPSSTTSMCIHQFNYSCEAGYVGRITRRLCTRYGWVKV